MFTRTNTTITQNKLPTTDNRQPEVHVEQNGEVSRLVKRGRDGNRFDDNDFRVPYYPKLKQSVATHKSTVKPASQPKPIVYGTNVDKGEESSQNAKKPRRANFFD